MAIPRRLGMVDARPHEGHIGVKLYNRGSDINTEQVARLPSEENVMAKGNNSQGRDRKKAKTAPKKEGKATPKAATPPSKKKG